VIDLHNHLMPGVDDGARSAEEAVAAAARMWEAGITRIITTPHLDGSLTERPALLETRLAEFDVAWSVLQAALGPDAPRVGRGTEVKLDTPTPDFGDGRLRLGGTRFVLVEFPYMAVPPGVAAVFERIRGQGWVPVLAHPERYNEGRVDLEMARDWRRAGAYLQVNCGALTGRHGDEVRRTAWRLLEAGLADLLASDYHSRGRVGTAECAVLLDEVGAGETRELLMRVNPGRIADDQAPLTVPPLERVRPGLWKRLSGVFRS
jgi:protein-tyrosine phosphatase